jgi:hypothetical protein
VLQWAQAFAGRALAAPDPVAAAYQLAYSRTPDPFEKDTIATFFHKQKALIHERSLKGEKIALPEPINGAVEAEYAAAFVDFCQMLISSNEFVYRN